jgi:serine/threonine protein kinase
MILGTPAYIAPEQVLATSVGPETDVYATATVLYELLAGELPYPPTKTAMDTLRQHVNDDPRPLSALAPRVPRQLAQVVMRGLNKDAADRYPSAKALGDAVALAAADAWGADWLETSGEEVLAGAMPAPPPRPPTRPAPRAPAPPPRPPAGPARPVAPARGRRPVLPLAVAGVVLVAVVAAVAALLTRHDDPQRAITPTTPTSTSVTGTPAPTRQFLTIEYDRATEATQQMYSAWRHGDRAIALQVAAPAAVDQLFRLPFKDGKANECADSSSTEIDCSYEYGTTIIGFRYDVKGRQIIAARPPS